MQSFIVHVIIKGNIVIIEQSMKIDLDLTNVKKRKYNFDFFLCAMVLLQYFKQEFKNHSALFVTKFYKPNILSFVDKDIQYFKDEFLFSRPLETTKTS